MADKQTLISMVREDMEVYCSDGEKVGKVGEVNIGTETSAGQVDTEERSFFQVKRGIFGLGDDLYVPAEQIQEVTDDRVVLACTKDELSQVAWPDRPRSSEEAGTDLEGPAPGIAAYGLRNNTQGPGSGATGL